MTRPHKPRHRETGRRGFFVALSRRVMSSHEKAPASRRGPGQGGPLSYTATPSGSA